MRLDATGFESIAFWPRIGVWLRFTPVRWLISANLC